MQKKSYNLCIPAGTKEGACSNWQWLLAWLAPSCPRQRLHEEQRARVQAQLNQRLAELVLAPKAAPGERLHQRVCPAAICREATPHTALVGIGNGAVPGRRGLPFHVEMQEVLEMPTRWQLG
jgi:hypothetical protein